MKNFNINGRKLARTAKHFLSIFLLAATVLFSIKFIFTDKTILADKMTINNQLDYLVKEHGSLKKNIKRLQEELKQLQLSVAEIHSENSNTELITISASELSVLKHQAEVLQEKNASAMGNPQPIINNNQNGFDPVLQGHREKQESQKYINEIELKFSKQKYIPEWSENKTRLIKAQLNDIQNTRASSGVPIKNIDCRESICRFEIPHQSVDKLEEFEMEFLMKLSEFLPITIISRSTDSDGRLNAIYYLSESHDYF